MKATINEEIVEIARKYVGQEEIPGNLGFKEEEFQIKMTSVGWNKGDAWCSYFAELVWKEAYQQWDATLFQRLNKLFTGSAVTTFRNFQKTKDFVFNVKPKQGALVVWQNYKEGNPHWTGHIGIVEMISGNNSIVHTIEGNTNDDGGREGIEVARKNRPVKYDIKQNGLVLLGFIWPKEV